MERNLGHRARAAGWRTLSIALLLGTGLPGGCARPDAVEQEPRPQRAGEPLDVVQTAGTMAGIRASAIVGDQKGVRQGLESLQTDFMRSARIPEVRRRIDRESARTVVSAMDGVASVVWLDATNLLVMVDQNAGRSEAMIDRVCLGLEPLGDTLGVVINVQSTAARSGREQATLSRNCQLPVGEHAAFQRPRAVDVVPEHVWLEQEARAAAEVSEERARRARENFEILRDSTPELPQAPRRQ